MSRLNYKDTKNFDMNKSSIELQNIDCNCNDCIFMKRDFGRYNQSLNLHHKWQLDYFNIIKSKADIEIAKNMRFEFDKSTAAIHFGQCLKFNKDISFIPNICQIETHKCFKHRRL